LLGALVLTVCAGQPADAKYYSGRQYYSGWKYNNSNKYYYRSYYYKPRKYYPGYKHHYAIYYPSKPNHYYFYNPYKKVYWGRCSVHYPEGQPQYSKLPEKYRKGDLNEINENDFPPPKKMPRIPEAQDNADMEPPPDDLPQNANLPNNK
jgi:hypothetical protein